VEAIDKSVPPLALDLSFLWWAFTAFVGLVWLLRHRAVSRGSRQYVLRPDEAGPPADELPPLTVLVAAKDEQDNISRCLEGLLAQNYPRLEVIAVNDRSTDRTGRILDEFAARDPRLRAVHVAHLPEGWFGKNHAMHVGMRQARGTYLCFTDADCTYESPQLLSAAVRFAMRESVDLLSVLPRLETHGFWECVVQPVAGAVMLYWFPPDAVNNPRAPQAYANGAFMLLPREAYDRLGGHERVRATLNEDIHLARRAKRLGLRLRVVRGEHLYRVRMYTGLREIWGGWSRIFYGCLGTFPRLLGSVVMLSLFSISPYMTLLLSPRTARPVSWAAVAAFTVLAQQSVLWRYYQIGGSGRLWALTYPLGAVLCLGMTLNAMRRLAGGAVTVWRGTAYRGGAQA